MEIMDKYTQAVHDTLDWMITDMVHRHEGTGIGGDLSPELRMAIAMRDSLSAGKVKVTLNEE